MMKIGIYTIHNAYNYGAMLQAFATQKALEKLGYQAELVNLYPLADERRNESKEITFTVKSFLTYLYARLNPKVQKKYIRFREFHALMKLSKRYYTTDEIYANPPQYDVHLVGSDQVWNLERGFQKKTYFFLDFLESDAVKISYASSFGTSTIPASCNSKLKKLLCDFKAISTRENEGVYLITQSTGKKAEQVLDPTLLLSKENWGEYISDKKEYDGEYILIYALNNDESTAAFIQEIKKRYKLPVFGIPMGIKVPARFNVDKQINDVGPCEFLSLFKNAKLVCTSSFHGLAFAVNFEKTFYVVPHPTRNSRLNSLLGLLNLESRQKFTPEGISKLRETELFMNYENIRALLSKEIEKSMNFMKSNL